VCSSDLKANGIEQFLEVLEGTPTR